jgi:uncharacterized heparinase superfamily protein
MILSLKKRIRTICLLYWTIRYLSFHQVIWRCRRWLRHYLPISFRQSLLGPIHGIKEDFRPLFRGLHDINDCEKLHPKVEQAAHRAAGYKNKRFTYLNHEHVFNGSVDWATLDVSQLWRYHLHYFDIVQDLLLVSASGQQDSAWHTFKELADSWIDSNPLGNGDGWHPYTISLRLVNWIHALYEWQDRINSDPGFQLKIIDSIADQAGYLFDDLEMDVRGNHLIKNLKTMVFVSVAFRFVKAEQFLKRALTFLKIETAEQILPDGGHFERNPGYHLTVLKDYLDIGLLLQRNGNRQYDWIDGAISRMASWAIKIQTPDGKLPTLKDTTWSTLEPSVEEILDVAATYLNDLTLKKSLDSGIYPILLFGVEEENPFEESPVIQLPVNSIALEDSGFFVFKSGNGQDFLVVDAGKPCPDYLPAHAHADMFSFELYVGGERVFVDSGVYEYTAGKWRDYFRSTRAHNSVEISGKDQSEVWGSFRVARRSVPIGTKWHFDERVQWIQSQHDGYTRLPEKIIHRRSVIVFIEGIWIFIDELFGKGEVSASSFLHLHPDFTYTRRKPNQWSLSGTMTPIWITTFQGPKTWVNKDVEKPVIQGWFSESFNQKVANEVLTLSGTNHVPTRFGYAISKNSPVSIEIGTVTESTLALFVKGLENEYRVGINDLGVNINK